MNNNKAKLSFDLYPTGDQLVPFDQFTSISLACVETLTRLGNLSEMVEAFRITWIYASNVGPGVSPGPRFTIYFVDPLGGKASCTTDCRFIGKGTVDPTAEEIADFLTSYLSPLISRHIRSCGDRLQEEQRKFSEAATKMGMVTQ
ncbi:MAG: hypothetical protein WCO09_04205 [bacterium]